MWSSLIFLVFFTASSESLKQDQDYFRQSKQMEKQILDEILGSDNYDKRIIPDGIYSNVSELDRDKKNNPCKIVVNTYLRAIEDINDSKMEYTVQLTFRQEWTDKRLLYNNTEHHFQYLTLTDMDKVWTPDTFFTNEKGAHRHDVILPNMYIRIFPNGRILYSIRISLTLSCPMNLKLYPMDSQICEMKIASYSYPLRDLVYSWNEIHPVQINGQLNLPRFTLDSFKTSNCNVKTDTGNYSCLKVSFLFKREFSYYLLTVYIPLCMLVIVSWVSFWLDSHCVPARVAIGVTTVLTMSTQVSGANRSLPPVAYTKALDVWNGACILFVFSALLEFAFVNYADRKSRDFSSSDEIHGLHLENGNKKSKSWISEKFLNRSKQIDIFARLCFPLAFAIFNLSYWTYYLISERSQALFQK